MTAKPLQITPVRGHTIYHAIVQEPVAKVEPPTGEYHVGMRVPPSAQLYTVHDLSWQKCRWYGL